MPETSHAAPRPIVVKLGGSLVSDPRLPDLLAALARAGAPRVLVAGGGPLADGVRHLQPRLRLSEAACHRMAILAMEQTAIAFADMTPDLALADSPETIAQAHAQGRVALWLPARMALAARDLPEDWDLTSDSLAAWLAYEIGAARLVLVKSAPTAARTTPADWAACGLVDPLFPAYAARLDGAVELVTIDAALTAFTKGSLAA